jgi:hypothetical protein
MLPMTAGHGPEVVLGGLVQGLAVLDAHGVEGAPVHALLLRATHKMITPVNPRVCREQAQAVAFVRA